MLVPDRWWKGYSGNRPNPGEIVGFDPNVPNKQYFALQFDTETHSDQNGSGPYPMRYDMVFKYTDISHKDFLKYDLPEELRLCLVEPTKATG